MSLAVVKWLIGSAEHRGSSKVMGVKGKGRTCQCLEVEKESFHKKHVGE